MSKTSKQVQRDIYSMLRQSKLASVISGDVYHKGYRPRDSAKEDAIIAFTAGVPGEVQSGVVTINIYVPDIDPYDNGVMAENGTRTEEIEVLAQKWVDSLTVDKSSYKFNLKQTIYTENDSQIGQHFVVVRLGFKLYEQQ